MIMLKNCQQEPFDIVAMTPRGTPGLRFAHIANQ